MDESLNRRQELLFKRLKARTDPTGGSRPGYAENVAAIRAELAVIEEKMRGRTQV